MIAVESQRDKQKLRTKIDKSVYTKRFGGNIIIEYLKYIAIQAKEASRSAGAQSVTVNATGCRFNPHSKKRNIYFNLYFHFFALVSRQCASLSSKFEPSEFGGKWGTVCLNNRFPLPFAR